MMNKQSSYKYTVCIHCMTYNHKPYILDALRGFAMQQTKFPYVAIVMDDASTDGEPEVLRQYIAEQCDTSSMTTKDDELYELVEINAKDNPNCHFAFYFLKQNLYGTGRKKPIIDEWDANAKYIALCEGDDYWTDPLKLQKQVDFLESHPDYSLCCTRFDIFQENTQQLIHSDLYNNEKIDDDGMELTMEHLSRGVVPHPHTQIYRKNILKDDELWPKLSWHFDYPFYYCIFRSGKRVWLMNENTAVYRKHEGSLTHRSSIGGTKTFYMLWKEIYQYDKTSMMYEMVVYHIKKLLNVYIRISKTLSYITIKSLIKEFYSMHPSNHEKCAFWIKIFKAFVYRLRHKNNREDGGIMFNNQSI